jgi:5-methylcytosine-specific restriction endonuclease McrA
MAKKVKKAVRATVAKKEDLTTAMKNKAEYLESGKKIPICANEGCDNLVIVRDWKYFSFKHLCSDCSYRMRNELPPREGVIFTKKNYCENRDGRLGFVCPVRTDYKFPSTILHGDHIDGNHENNKSENIQTLCSICHHLKGLSSGDFVSAKKGRKLS